MNKKILSLIVIIAIIGGLAFLKSRNTNTDNNKADVADLQNDQENKSFEEFMKSENGSYVCNVEQNVSDFESKGIVYIKNGADMSSRKIHGEFTTNTQGMNVTTNFIMTDGFSYTWSSILPNMGFKVKIQEQKAGDSSTQMSGTYGFDTKQIGSYDCKSWEVDESKFTVPSSIKFTEQPNPQIQ